MIGPEGGFNEDEVNQLKDHHFSHVSLGEYRLRSETAAISLVSTVCQYIEFKKEVHLGNG